MLTISGWSKFNKMKAVLGLVVASVLLFGVTHGLIGLCMEMCGQFGSLQCPAGYECRSNGCGHTCLKAVTTGSVAVKCQPVFCEIFCVAGWAKNEHGCDICACRKP